MGVGKGKGGYLMTIKVINNLPNQGVCKLVIEYFSISKKYTEKFGKITVLYATL